MACGDRPLRIFGAPKTLIYLPTFKCCRHKLHVSISCCTDPNYCRGPDSGTLIKSYYGSMSPIAVVKTSFLHSTTISSARASKQPQTDFGHIINWKWQKNEVLNQQDNARMQESGMPRHLCQTKCDGDGLWEETEETAFLEAVIDWFD